jgi:N-acetylneuraminic acid mutarotase
LKLGNPLDIVFQGTVSSTLITSVTPNKLNSDLQYYIAGFIVTKKDTIFASSVTVDGKYRNKPVIESITPTHGKPGDYITVLGRNFDDIKANLSITFGTYEGEIVSAEFEKLTIRVPAYDVVSDVSIVLTRKAIMSDEIFFSFDGPRITSFTPDHGTGDFTFTITGHGFSEDTWRNTVNLWTIPPSTPRKYSTQVVEASSNTLKIRVNSNRMLPEAHRLTVITDGLTAVAEQPVEIKTPWVRLADKPSGGMAYSGNFEIDSKIYLVGGTSSTNTGGYHNQVWQYDISLDQWTRKADFPGGTRVEAVAFSVNGKGYFGLGTDGNSNYFSDLWEYNPEADSWIEKSEMPGGNRTGALSFSNGNKGYVIFGYSVSGKHTDFWSYDPGTDSWQEEQAFGGKYRSSASHVIKDNKLFIIGGIDGTTSDFINDLWSYDFSTHQWKFRHNLDFMVHSSFVVNSRTFIIAYQFNDFMENEMAFFEYDEETNTRKELPQFPAALRARAGLFLVKNNKIIVGLGINQLYEECLADFWMYPINE